MHQREPAVFVGLFWHVKVRKKILNINRNFKIRWSFNGLSESLIWSCRPWSRSDGQWIKWSQWLISVVILYSVYPRYQSYDWCHTKITNDQYNAADKSTKTKYSNVSRGKMLSLLWSITYEQISCCLQYKWKTPQFHCADSVRLSKQSQNVGLLY